MSLKAGLGDVILTMPMFTDLHRAFQDATLDFCLPAQAVPMAAEHPHIAGTVPYDRATRHGLPWRVRRGGYDWVLDVVPSDRSALIVGFSGARVRVGRKGIHDSPLRIAPLWALYTHTVRHDPLLYGARDRQRLLEALGICVGPPQPWIYLADRERAEGQELARSLRLDEAQPCVGIFLRSGAAVKEWPVDRFAHLALALRKQGIAPLIFRGIGEDKAFADFSRLARGVAVAPLLPLRAFLCLLATCRAFVSTDIGPAHMAQALGVPTITLFGSTNPVIWNCGPPMGFVVRAEHVPCLGCGRRTCPVGHRCMTELGVEPVIDTVLRVVRSRDGMRRESVSGQPKEAVMATPAR